MSRRQTHTLAWIVIGALAIAALAGWIGQPEGAAPPAPPAIEAPQLKPAPPATPEAAAGGQLVGGQWHFGYTPNPGGTQRFLRSLPRPLLSQAGPDLVAKDRGDKPVLLYRALQKAYSEHAGGAEWIVGSQGIGDCVSWAWAHGADIHLAVIWQLGVTSEWRPAATEAIYGGSRVEARGVRSGGWGDGSYGGAAAKWVSGWGILFREPYDELGLDLTHYDRNRAKQWGNYGCGGNGDNGRADAIAKLHPIRQVALVRNFTEAAAAIAAGYPVPVCSGQGFSSQRDGEGFSRPSGSWSHAMCFMGVRHDRKGLLCLNSWGPNWIRGAKWPEDQPDGSFWVDAAVCDRMLRGEDSFAVSGYEGFPWRDLRHGDWVRIEPQPGPETSQTVVRSRPFEPQHTADPHWALAP